MANNTAIEMLIENSLNEFLEIGREDKIRQDAGARLIFPIYSHGNNKGKRRISEQELRFFLAKKLEEEKIYYSVETPTKKKYVFKKAGKNSRSGLIDLCLHNSEGKRTNLIELKHNDSFSEISKDFKKLLFDFEAEQNYFVHLDSRKSKKIDKIKEDYEKALEKALEFKPREEIESSIKILLFVIREKKLYKKLYKYEISKAGELKDVEN